LGEEASGVTGEGYQKHGPRQPRKNGSGSRASYLRSDFLVAGTPEKIKTVSGWGGGNRKEQKNLQRGQPADVTRAPDTSQTGPAYQKVPRKKTVMG